MILYKKEIALNIIVLVLLILLSESSLLLSDLINRTLLYILIILYLFYNKTKLNNRILLISFTAFFLHFLTTQILSFSENGFSTTLLNRQIGFYLKIYISLFLAYMLICAYKGKLFTAYSNVVFYLSLISLILFSLQLIFPQSVFNFIQMIQNAFGIPINEVYVSQSNRISYATALFYTVNSQSNLIFENRNAGFCFEPTAFASFLILAITINLFKYNLKINWKLIILIIALLTTYSTTGYIGLIILMFWFLYNNKRVSIIYFLTLILAIGIVIKFSNLPFGTSKIIENINSFGSSESRIQLITKNRANKYDVIALGRIESLGYIINNEFVKSPIIGNGGVNKRDEYLSLVSGIGELLSSFGILGLLFFSYFLYKGSSSLSRPNFKFKSVLMLLILINMVSYNFLFNVFFLAILFVEKKSSIFFYKNKNLSIHNYKT